MSLGLSATRQGRLDAQDNWPTQNEVSGVFVAFVCVLLILFLWDFCLVCLVWFLGLFVCLFFEKEKKLDGWKGRRIWGRKKTWK